MITINDVVLVFWAIYWLYSIVGAIGTRASVKVVARGETFFERVIQKGLMLVALYLIYSPYLGYLAVCVIPEYVPLMLVGCVMVVVSLLFAEWGRSTLAANWSSAVHAVENQKLIQHGPYRFIRNPIYTGVTGAFLGTFLVQGTLAAFIALVCLIVKYVLKIRKEEQFLLALFGEDYKKYRSKTWAMVPFIY